MFDNTCKNCVHFQIYDAQTSICRRFPPVSWPIAQAHPLTGKIEQGVMTMFSQAPGDLGACGEYRVKPYAVAK